MDNLLSGNLTIDEYVRLVRDEERDVKEEVLSLLRILQSEAQTLPATTIQTIVDAIASLLEHL